MWRADAASSSEYLALEDEDPALDDLRDAAAAVDSALDTFSANLLNAEAEAAATTDTRLTIESTLRAAQASGDAAQRACRELTLEISAANADGILDSGDAEARRLRTQAVDAQKRLERLLSTLDFLRTSRQREALLGVASNSKDNGGGSSSAAGADNHSPSDLIALGMKVQLESQASIQRMTRMVEASKDVGASTLNTLEGQHKRLDMMVASVSAQEFQYGQAARELDEFAEYTLGDQFTLLLLLLIGIAITFVVVYKLSVLPPETRFIATGPEWPTEVYSALDLRLS